MKVNFNYIPQRFILAFMAFLAIANAYHMRISLNVTITEMVDHKLSSLNDSSLDPYICPDPVDENGMILGPPPPGTVLYDWSEESQGLILSSFYAGYVVTHLPGGFLADKYGGKYTLGLGLLATSIFTLLIPPAANGGYTSLVITRLMTGVGEGTTFPAVTALMSKWVPLEERGFLGSCVYSGGQIGAVVGSLMAGHLLTTYRGHWEIVFYTFGGIGLIWCPVWFLLCYSRPETNPFITEKEKEYLFKRMPPPKKIPRPPYLRIITSPPLLALLFAQCGHNWVLYTVVTDLPKYMNDVLKLTIKQNGYLSALPFLIMWLCSLSSGKLCDILIKRGFLSVTAARRAFTTVAHIGPTFGLVGASYAGCNITFAVFLFCFGMGTMGFFYPGMKVNSMDLSPNYAGTLMAITHGFGSISGVIALYLAGVLTPNRSLLEWRKVFWITGGVNLVTLAVFLIFCSGEVQPWNDYNNNQDQNER